MQRGPQNVDCLASTLVEVQVRGQAPCTELDVSPGHFQLNLTLIRHAPPSGVSGELLTEVKVQVMHAKHENVFGCQKKVITSCCVVSLTKSSQNILGALAKLLKATVSCVMPVRLSACQQFGSHWTNLDEIWNLRMFRKSK